MLSAETMVTLATKMGSTLNLMRLSRDSTGYGPADLLVPLAAKMSEEPFRLVIMDSVAANLRVDFTGRGAA